MRSNLSVFALIAVAVPSWAAAQSTPVISTVSGTVSQGSTVTIDGSYLVAEKKTPYAPYWTSSYPNAGSFEGGSPAADGWRENGSGGVYDSSVKLTGNQSMRFTLQNTSVGGDYGDNTSLYQTQIPYTDFYLRYYTRYHRNSSSGWPNNKFKTLYFQSPVEGWVFAPQLGSEWPASWNMNDGPGNNFFANPSGNIAPDRWYCIEHHVKLTSPLTWTVWVDGVQIGSLNPANGPTRDSFMELGFIASDGPSGFSLSSWWDGMATGSSRLYPLAKVEIGNKADYATATKRYQPPTLLSDGRIGIAVDLTGLGSGPYYLWVTNNQQQRSAAYSLTGVGSFLVTPQAPRNVTIR